MPVPTDAGSEAVGKLIAEVRQRWQVIDPLLPAPALPSPGSAVLAGGQPGPHCGARLAVGDGHGLVAVGSCEHWQGEPDSLDVTWAAARRFQLTPLVGGQDVAGALDALLSQWREHLSSLPSARDADTAAVINWPSRDIDGPSALLRHGFAPAAVIAAKAAGRDRFVAGAADAGTEPPGVRVRRASPADIDAVVRLGLDAIRFDWHFCGVNERPGTADALGREASGLLAGPQPWVWLAERDGAAVGMLACEQPEQANWIAPMTGRAPVAYLLLMGVQASERAQGIGAALAARLDGAMQAAGISVALLHYAQINPLSVPFWSQQGYRPLWTEWEAWPPAAVR